jgi:CRP-like cAMP-binding protein
MYWPAKLKRSLGFESEAKLPGIYLGDDARTLISNTLFKNPAIGEDEAIVKQIIERGELVFFRRGEQIIAEGAQDCDVYFLLSGEVDIVFKSQLGSRRQAPNQVGEMAAIDLCRKRSASVFARTNEVAAIKIPGLFFNSLWKSNPRFQQLLQVEMSARHRERIVAGEIARRDNSAVWFAISGGAGIFAGLVTWLCLAPVEWTAIAKTSISGGAALSLFVFCLMHNPAFFWRRCFGLVLVAMIGTFTLDRFVSIEAKQGFGSLQINVGPGMDAGGKWEDAIAYILVLIVCACMDFFKTRD